MSELTAPEPAAAKEPRVRYGWASITIAVVFGLLYAYVLWTAIGNLIQLPKELGAVTPWWLLVLDVALPLIVYVVAFLMGRRRAILSRLLFFLVGATLLACATVGSIAFVRTH